MAASYPLQLGTNHLEPEIESHVNSTIESVIREREPQDRDCEWVGISYGSIATELNFSKDEVRDVLYPISQGSNGIIFGLSIDQVHQIRATGCEQPC